MGFQQGLSGLNVSAKSLDAIGNNIANSSTVGYKTSAVQFADVYAASLGGGGAGQIGIGASAPSISQLFTQGNITTTNNPLDMAINGGGFYRLSDGGTPVYSRNGQFSLDKDGYVVNPGGLRVTGYGVDTMGVVVPGDFVELQLSTTNIEPNTTTTSQVQVNLDSRALPPAGYKANIITATADLSALSSPYTIDSTNNTLVIQTNPGNGGPTTSGTVTIPAGSYSGASALVTAVQAGITSANVPVTVSLDSTGKHLVFTSEAVGTGVSTSGTAVNPASVSVTGGTALANLVGGFVVPDTQVASNNFALVNGSPPVNSYTASTAQTVYDSLGNPHTMTMYFAKTSNVNTWQLYTALDGNFVTTSGTIVPTPLSFSPTGALTSPSTPIQLSFEPGTGAQTLAYTLDLTGSSQYGINFGVNNLLQDGYTSGRLTGISVSPDGTVQGRYSNGKTRNQGQVVLVNFNNANGLTSLGNNVWGETAESGQPIPGTPGQGSLGLIQSAAVEESNVDLTAELVNMITQQRVYQANAQTIKTQDQVLQTLVNLR
jgi:flagellar hook protein FlgE